MGRNIVRAGIALLASVALVAVSLLLYRTWRQHAVAQYLAITSPNGIDEEEFVRIGGIEQYITIRGEDRANPAILFVHGGPGDSMVPFAQLYRPWEKSFTVVQWDQRGAGKTFARNGRRGEDPLTIERVVRDGLEVAQYLHTRLHAPIILLAHSWGTIVGVQMVKRRPDLFAAYVGTGQVVAKEEKEKILYARTMARARQMHDADGIARLKVLGPPPYKSEHDLLIEREVSGRYDVRSERTLRETLTPVVLSYPGYSLWDIHEFLEAPKFSAEVLYRPQLSFDARALGPRFELPFFIFEGDADTITPPDLARHYLDFVEAPAKGFVTFPNAGHGAIETAPDAFLQALLSRVRPLIKR